MSINALFDEFKVKAATPKQQLAEYKAQGKKVIGVLPYYAPEELVYAAGMVPMGIWAPTTRRSAVQKSIVQPSTARSLSSHLRCSLTELWIS